MNIRVGYATDPLPVPIQSATGHAVDGATRPRRKSAPDAPSGMPQRRQRLAAPARRVAAALSPDLSSAVQSPPPSTLNLLMMSVIRGISALAPGAGM